MGSIQLYTQPNKQGMQTYQAGTFTLTDLDKGTDYVEGYLKKIEVQSINRECWFTKLTLRTGALSQLDMTNATSLLPQVNMEAVENSGTYYYKPTNCDPAATALATRPLDWDIHWRDKYTAEPTLYTTTAQPARQFYANQPLSAPTSGGIPSERAFVADTYYETNQGRYLFWTLSDCYFAVEGTWQASLGGFGTACTNGIIAFNAGMGSTNASTRAAARYVNCLRERGYLGPMINLGTEAEFHNFCSYSSTSVTPDVQETRALAGFVQFSYPITLESEEVINVDMMGICVYRVTADGYISEAQISAISEDFWKGKVLPPYTGPTSTIQGGGGSFTNNPGTGTLANIQTQVGHWNAALGNFYGGYNRYIIPQGAMTPFNEFTQNLRNPEFLQGVINSWISPLSAIICCHAIPNPLSPHAVSSDVIRVNDFNMSKTATSTFVEMATSTDIGFFDTLTLSEYYGNFLDYSDTSVYVHLPFIGIVQLDTTACMKGTLSVMYTCDPMTGDVIAYINVQDRDGSQENRYSFKGNCSYQIPMATITPWSTATIMSLARTGIRTGLGALTGGLSGAIAANAVGVYRSSMQEGIDAYQEIMGGAFPNSEDLSAIRETAQYDARNAAAAGARQGALMGAIGGISTIGNGFGTGAMAGASTLSSNGGSGTSTATCDTRCWVMVTRPAWSNPEYYSAQNGYPADQGIKVGDAIGLLATASVEVQNIKATDNERAEIEELLRRGVYVSNPYV